MVKDKKILLLDVVVIAAPILLVVALMAFATADRSDLPFDADKWRAEPSGCSPFSSDVRRRMSADLERTLLKASPPAGKREIQQMLGEPDVWKKEQIWAYALGTSIADCLSFDVRFDEKGVIVSARQVQH